VHVEGDRLRIARRGSQPHVAEEERPPGVPAHGHLHLGRGVLPGLALRDELPVAHHPVEVVEHVWAGSGRSLRLADAGEFPRAAGPHPDRRKPALERGLRAGERDIHRAILDSDVRREEPQSRLGHPDLRPHAGTGLVAGGGHVRDGEQVTPAIDDVAAGGPRPLNGRGVALRECVAIGGSSGTDRRDVGCRRLGLHGTRGDRFVGFSRHGQAHSGRGRDHAHSHSP